MMKVVCCCLLVSLFLLLFSVGQCVRIQVEHLPEQCDYAKCPTLSDKQINVHLVPHTHDDVGWLKTVDQYYYGLRSKITTAGVQYILDAVIDALVHNKERRFVYVESAFFAKWWQEQDQQTQEIVRELVTTGQLEFANGGWVMNDEATTHYSAIIDQMTLGLRFLNDTFGHCAIPRAAWQIDPFGHSREQANLFAQMNFDGLFFTRLDWQDAFQRRLKRKFEFVWQGSDDLGSSGDLFTSILNKGRSYGPPTGFDWDLIGGIDSPVVDNVLSEEYNVNATVSRFIEKVLEQFESFTTQNILFSMGEDFNYQNANTWYKNMDKLIKHVNERQDHIRVFYSTPSCYLKAIHDSKKLFATKSDDFFPYSSDQHAFWTGYFTSRPALKRMERVGNNWLQACKQIDVFAHHRGKYSSKVRVLQEAMGIMQHHDAVAGTEKQHVANDYAKQLQHGLDNCKQVINYGLKQLTMKKSSQSMTSTMMMMMDDNDYQFCDHLNISSCAATEAITTNNVNVTVLLYNPFGQPLYNHTVRLPVIVWPNRYIQVFDSDTNRPIQSTLFPLPPWVATIPGRKSNATHELVFDTDILPLGLAAYTINHSSQSTMDTAVFATKRSIRSPFTVKFGDNKRAYIDPDGALSKISLWNGQKYISLKSEFYYYEGHNGNNTETDWRASGAYIFRPVEQTPKKLGKLIGSVLYANPTGGLVEIHQNYDSFAQLIIRFHHAKDYVEFVWFVDSIPVEDQIGKEVVIRYSSDLASNSTFFTDANGRQILKRRWNYRPTWKYSTAETISGNYYPVNSRIFIQDQIANVQLSVLNERSQGGSSPDDGQIELMLHRRLLHDDAFGVDEALNETGPNGKGLVVLGRHFVLLDHINVAARQHRLLSQKLYLEPIIAFNLQPASNIDKQQFDNELTTKAYQKTLLPSYTSLLAQYLPANVHLLTLEQWTSDTILLRLEHFYQSNEDDELSKEAIVDLAKILPSAQFKIVHIEELTLGANQYIAASKHRFSFNHKTTITTNQFERLQLNKESTVITLKPMQIRTFYLTIE